MCSEAPHGVHPSSVVGAVGMEETTSIYHAGVVSIHAQQHHTTETDDGIDVPWASIPCHELEYLVPPVLSYMA